MQTLHVHQGRAMRHLLKLCKTINGSRHLFSCLGCSPSKTASCPSSADALFNTHNPTLSSADALFNTHNPTLISQLPSYRHSHCARRYLHSVCCNSPFHRSSPYETVELKHKQTGSSLSVPARCKQTSSTEHLLSELKAKEYTALYLHNKIRILRVFCSAAKYSTLMLFITNPVCAAATLGDMMTQETCLFIVASLTFYSALFSIQSYFFIARFICKVMLSTDEEYVKISHLTVFGKRRDLYVKHTDIIPIPGSLYDKKFHTVQFLNSCKKLYFLPHHGEGDTNYEVLEALFTKHGVHRY